jgi:cysteine-S-conjugate beta-lyase
VKPDFDRIIRREGTSSLKHDGKAGVFGTDDVLPMWVADMDFAAPEAVTKALEARAAHAVYGYTLMPDSLYDALIGWMKKRHCWQIEREWILLTPGVVPSLNVAVMALTCPGEGVIVQPPVYPPFFSAAKKTGRRLVENPLQYHEGCYRMDFDGLEHCARNARLLLLCSPHNPVGRVWRPEELKTMLDIAIRHYLTILSDEIHADLVYPDFQHHVLASMADNTANIVTAVAPSKTFNIPGLGLSALIVPDARRRAEIGKALDMIHVSAANPFSIVAFEAAYRDGEAWLASLINYLKESRDEVASFIERELPEICLTRSEGTYLLWLDCRKLGMSDNELQGFFVHHAKVGMSPGVSFGTGGSGCMRMNIGAPLQVVMTALQHIRDALDGY